MEGILYKMSKLRITETALRDGHQSLMATRLRTDEIIPILQTMDKVGYHSMEVWGGATFDSCIRFLNEDPWERLRLIRKHVKNTKLQMLLRGQNLLGYRHYGDDTVERFIELSIKNGIDIIRVFDALNDVRNLEQSMKAIKKYNGHCQVAISFTTSPVHTTEYYIELIKTVEKMGADSICIKDMEGGVDIIDTAISPLSGGTSQPPTESMVVSLSEMDRNPELDMDALLEVAEYFKPIRDKYMEEGILDPKVLLTDPQTLKYQVPGGMLSNLLSQLKQQGAESKYEEVLNEVPRVRQELGYPPLVTPLSQMVGTQAVFNVLTGQRYKIVPKEIKDYVKGLYGQAPAELDPEVKKLIIGDEEVITVRPADLIGNEFEAMKKEVKDLAQNDEDVLAYALFPQIAPKYLESKYNKSTKVEEEVESNITYIEVTM